MQQRGGRVFRRWSVTRTLVVVSLLGSAAMIWRAERRDAVPSSTAGLAPLQSVDQLRTSIYSHDALALRVVAGNVTLRRPRVLGPFRLGVLRSVEARDVTIETFEQSHGHNPSTASAVKQAMTALLPERLRKTIVQAAVEHLELIHHGADGSAVRITAHRCDSAFAREELVCTHGVVRRGATETPFREAVFDASGQCRLDGKPCEQ